mgnify:CR=1 FL=1
MSRVRKARRVPRRRRRAVVALAVVAGLAVVGTGTWLVARRLGSERGRALAAAREALGRGDLGAATAFARRAVAEAPSEHAPRRLLELVLERSGAADEARALLEEDVRRDVDDDGARVLLAALDRRDEDYAAALRHLGDAVERDPTPASAYRLRGELRAATGDRAGAAADFAEAARRDPRDVAAWLAWGDVTLADVLETGSATARHDAGAAYAAAERLCRARLAAGPDPRARRGLARALAGRVRALRDVPVADAAAELVRLVEEAGDDPGPTLVLAEFHRRFGNLAEAERVLQAELRRRPGAQARLALHDVLLERDNPSDALVVLRQGLEDDPGALPLHRALVAQLSAARRFDEARAALAALEEAAGAASRVAAEARGDVAVAEARAADDAGDTLRAAERSAAAREAYRAALAGVPRSMPLRKKLFAAVLDAAARGARDLDAADRGEARAFVDAVLAVNPGDADALAWRARLLLGDGDLAGALATLGPAVTQGRATVDMLRVFAAAAERAGRAEQAAEAYAAVVDQLTHANDPERRDDPAATAADWSAAARSALQTGHVDLALARADAGSAAWPGDLALRLARVRARTALGRNAEALLDLERARGDFPGSPLPRLLTAALLERGRRLAEAEATLRSAVAELPGPATRAALAGLLERCGRGGEAERLLLDAAQAGDDRGQAWAQLGRFYAASRPPRTDDARRAYENAAAHGGDAATCLVQLADLALLAAGRAPDALPAAREAVARAVSGGAPPALADYLEGKLALLAGDAERAAAALRRHCASGVPGVAGLYYLAKAERALGRTQAAEDALRTALATAPEDVALRDEVLGVLLEVSAEKLDAGDFGGALLALPSEAPGRAADRVAAAARAGQLDLDEAERLLDVLLAEAPEDRDLLHLLAAVLTTRADPARIGRARETYERLTALDPDDVPAWTALATLRLDAGDAPGAGAAFRQAYERSGGNAGVGRGLLDALRAEGRRDDALALVTRLLARETAADLLHARGTLLQDAGDVAGAAASFRAALDVDPSDASALVAAGAAVAQLEGDAAAEELLAARLDGLADVRPACAALATLAARAGRLDDAAAWLERAGGGGAPTLDLVLLRGAVADARGDAADARRAYAQAFERGCREPAVLARLAHLAGALGDPRAALEAWDALLDRTPGDGVAWNDRALLLAADPEALPRALESARRARELLPDEPAVADTLGWLLAASARPQEAEPLLEEAARALPDDARVRWHAAVVAARLGRDAAALAHVRRALELGLAGDDGAAARALLERLR